MGRTNGTTNPKTEKIERSVRRYSLITETSYSNSYKLSKVQIKKKCTHNEVFWFGVIFTYRNFPKN